MKKSFANLLFFYTLGILVFYYVDIPIKIIWIISVFSILCLYYNIIKSKLNQSILLCLLFVLGISLTYLHSTSSLDEYIGKEVEIKARVESLEKRNSDLEKYLIKIEAVEGKKIAKEKSLLTIIGEKNLKLGSTIDLKVIPKLPMENTNPGLFNYKLYLKSKSIHTIMTINEYKLSRVDLSDIKFRYKIKEKAIFKVENIFKPFLNKENNSLITSIILGDSSYLDEENVSLYRNMGLSHILAVSGLHIGIISSFLLYLLSRIGIKRRTNVAATLVFIWIYGYVIGYPPSILRASILFSFLYLSKLMHRPYDSVNILSLCGLILLITNPYNLFSIGFQLSFIASGSIIILTDRISDLFYPLKGKFIDTISSLLAVNIGISSLQIYYFNKVSILGLLANIIVVPILSLSLIIAFIMIGVDFLLADLNFFIGKALNFSLSLQFFIIRFFEKSPINLLRFFSPDIITILFVFLFIGLVFKFIDINILSEAMQKTLIVYLVFLLTINTALIKDNLQIHLIDVGQGDSIFIQSGRRNILIDTGGSIFKNTNIPEKIVLPYLEKAGVSKLDAIFISHFHEDHCQGLPLLLDEFKVERVFISHLPKDMYEDIIDERFIKLKKGDIVNLGNKMEFKVLWPKDDLAYDDNINNKSMVGVLNYNNTKMLFTGDVEFEAEAELLKDVGRVDILKVAHHGSDTSSTQDFLDLVSPRASIISVGRNNTYNHPSDSVVERLSSSLYRTDRDGLVKIVIEDGFKIEPYLINGEKERINLSDYIFYNYNYFLYNAVFFMVSYLLIKSSNREEIIYDI